MTQDPKPLQTTVTLSTACPSSGRPINAILPIVHPRVLARIAKLTGDTS